MCNKKLKNVKVTGKNEGTGVMVKSGKEIVIDWIWNFCKMTFASGVVAEN